MYGCYLFFQLVNIDLLIYLPITKEHVLPQL
jgi:hypothetical protein